MHLQKSSSFLLLKFIVFGVFMLVGVFGIYLCTNLFMSMTTPVDTGVHKSYSFNCAYGLEAGEHRFCPTSSLEHILNWQKIFTIVTPTGMLELLTAMLTLFIGVSGGIFFYNSTSPPTSIIRFYLYAKQRWATRLYNYLVDIFSRGILQPKLFA